MNEPLKWLPDGDGTPWKALGDAMRAGLPVPSGYFVFTSTPEADIRSAYEELKVREKTHFVAVRGSSHGKGFFRHSWGRKKFWLGTHYFLRRVTTLRRAVAQHRTYVSDDRGISDALTQFC